MYTNYTDEKNAQILISLLKHNGIKNIIVSPGNTNISLVRSLQNDSFFRMFSAVDERSAAYMACGLAEETGEPVVLSCTGATASRNYFPGLTEAYYRKLPILAVTSSQISSRIGQNFAQVTDRNSITADVVKKSYLVQVVKDEIDFKASEIKINDAILELLRADSGPIHINLETTLSQNFEIETLPRVKKIQRVFANSIFPDLPRGKIGIVIGSHKRFDTELTKTIDKFCRENNAVVFTDHTSGYKGEFRIQHSLASTQTFSDFDMKPDLTIQLGEISGDYSLPNVIGEDLWRVNLDGKIKDQFGKLSKVFEMQEEVFFQHYINADYVENTYHKYCFDYLEKIKKHIPELPFSNIWVAQKMHNLLPKNSSLHLGILNSLRAWNFFDIRDDINASSNVGGFGIDGILSTIIGSSFANSEKLFFGVIGDLAFFYDLNALGNKHVSKNVRILLINNGTGQEFRNYDSLGGKIGDTTNEFIAGGGHFGNKSKLLVKNYCENLGFEYISASNKDDFNLVYEKFISPEITDAPIVFEVFTDESEESEALNMIHTIDISESFKKKQSLKKIIGYNNIEAIKKLLNK